MMNAQEIDGRHTAPCLRSSEEGESESEKNGITVSTNPYDFTSRRVLMVGLVLLVLVGFSNSLAGDFVYDDREQIVGNHLNWDRATLTRVFVQDFWASLRGEQVGSQIDSIYYRPVFSLFLMAGHSLAGQNAVLWHLLVLLLHCVATLLVFCVLEKSLGFFSSLEKGDQRLLSALAAGVFAIHPAQSESVAWISGLVNPLSGTLVLAAACFYLKYRERNRISSLASALACFAAAVLAKENSLALVLIVPAYELFILNTDRTARARARSAILRTAPFGCVAAGYFALRYNVLNVLLGRSLDFDFPDDSVLTLTDSLRTLPVLLVGYLKIALFPVNLSIIYDVGYVKSLSFTSFWLPLCLVIAAGALLVYLSKRMAEFKLAAIWMFTPLLPHLNTRAFVSDEIIHDRYLYLSLVGVGLLVSILVFKAARTMRVPTHARVAAGILVLAVLSVAIIAQNRKWRSEGDLWRNAARHAPNSRIVRLALGTLAEDAQDFDGALVEYESVLAMHPDVVDGLNHSAFVYARQRRWADATRQFERIVAITPDKAIAHFNLSFAYAVQKRYSDAAREQRTAIDLDPNGARADEWRSRLAQIEKAMASAPTSNANPG